MYFRIDVCLALSLCFAPLLFSPASASHGDESFEWPQWRGPARDGISRETAWSFFMF